VKFSTSWKKQKRKIQRLHTHIVNIRKDCLHKTTTEISKNHAMIVIEDLKVSNMSKSAKGTTEQHGRNVKAKSGLNRSSIGIKTPKRVKKHHKTDVSSTPLLLHMNGTDD
ncbi:hypothetical protein APX81_00290, partial [Escherichia coli]